MLMSAADYRESLRRARPRVYVDGRAIDSVADEPALAPGIAAIGVTYDFALQPAHRSLMTARQGSSGQTVSRMLHINETTTDLLYKLEAVRLVCQEAGCAQRYLAHDALNAIFQATKRTDAAHGTDYHPRFLSYLHDVQDRDLTLGIAMTDAKGDRSKRPAAQANADVYVHVSERRRDGIVIRGCKAIVTAAPYVHEFLVMPCRTMTEEEAPFAVCCAVPVDAPGVTIVARRAGRPGESAARFSAKYGQSTGVVLFDDVFVPWGRVFLAGEHAEGGFLTTAYAAHHRHSCIGARAGFGNLLIGAGALMIEANGLDPDRHGHVRDAMVELITITESFFACGVARQAPAAAPMFWIFVAIVVLYAFAEGTFSNWAVIYLRDARGLPEMTASLALSAFWGALVIGRLVASALVARLAPAAVWAVLPVLMISAFLLLPSASSGVSGIVLFALAGFACSAFLPLSITLASHHFPQHVAWVSSMLIAALMVGVGIGSFAIGALRDMLVFDDLYRLSALYPVAVLLLAIPVLRASRRLAPAH